MEYKVGQAGRMPPPFATRTAAEGMDAGWERTAVKDVPAERDDAQQIASAWQDESQDEGDRFGRPELDTRAIASSIGAQDDLSQTAVIDAPPSPEAMMPQSFEKDVIEETTRPTLPEVGQDRARDRRPDPAQNLSKANEIGEITSTKNNVAAATPALSESYNSTPPPPSLILTTASSPIPPTTVVLPPPLDFPQPVPASPKQTSPGYSPPGGQFSSSSDIKFDYAEAEGHRILRLWPTRDQWDDFPAVLTYARNLNAEADGCFKVIIPDELHAAIPEKPAQHVVANAYKVKLIRRTAFWQVSTVPSEGVFSSSQPGQEFTESAEIALRTLKHIFRKNQNRQLRNIRYRVDVPAWTKIQRRLAGVPEQSPIYPLRGDKLDQTKAIIPGIHTPYVYESGPYFGATFQIHAEDFRLASLNHLYKGRKIWIVVPATAVNIAEEALGRGSGCSQFMRHRAEFFFPDKLEKLGIPYRIVDQRPGETIVILPDAYHEGFSCGYTIAEAKNYADAAWTTNSYQPCQTSCKLATAIPAAFMRPLVEGEERLDLCAAYGDGLSIPLMDGAQIPAPPVSLTPASELNSDPNLLKRGCDEEGYKMSHSDGKRIKVY